MPRKNSRRVIDLKLLETGSMTYYGTRKLYRLRLSCGHEVSRWAVTRVPSSTFCEECMGEKV